ncbi:acyl-CoA dehydrogenase [Desulfofundulus sp. TPOSR]|uniref:Butyryl-CoA dehydrogenase n=1 Tax=Desulfofundulus kuznetsovii (strain DSM 6115 / VKM B-1805 / 17) TaxID=760568 RepID=A0AAU8P9U5_DESK7|nr:acyl-CoA dehydrogenase [Desulfofundulus sp. TPOSR]AEG14807.1 Butyryl-CoA dehydrogenase [Desulfofundulus kuznetsovii DSM 6115]NHM25727.1 acyl-CoA dehydrogenase [Desulfofundulus sp. TPOSR]
MDFDLTRDQQLIREVVRDFAQKEILPRAKEIDRSGQFPLDIIKKLARMDLMGLPFPEEYGGAGGDYVSYCLALEEITRACASTGLTYEAHISLGCMPIYLFGTAEQKQKYLVPLCRGECLGAFGLTEPNAGSDAGGTQTTAVLRGDEWVINGSKCFITNASYARFVTITAVTDRTRGKNGISAFIVPTDASGLTIKAGYEKLGMSGSNTTELFFDDVRIPKENLLGQLNQGFKQFLQVLDGGRIAIGAMAVGIAQACLDAALNYARQRIQFGQSISKFQAVSFKLADMATNIEVARNMYLKAAWLKDQGRPYTKEAAMIKVFASEMATRAALDAIQIHGGYGYMKEFPVERHLRDAKLLEIGEGTSEIQRLVIARTLGC